MRQVRKSRSLGIHSDTADLLRNLTTSTLVSVIVPQRSTLVPPFATPHSTQPHPTTAHGYGFHDAIGEHASTAYAVASNGRATQETAVRESTPGGGISAQGQATQGGPWCIFRSARTRSPYCLIGEHQEHILRHKVHYTTGVV